MPRNIREDRTVPPGRYALWVLVLLAFCQCGCSTTVVSEPTLSPAREMTAERRAAHLDSFDHVWTTIRDKHWDPELGGLDWDAIRTEYQPQMETVKTDDEARRVLRAMIARLELSHFGIIPADVYDELDESDGDDDETDELGSDGDAPDAARDDPANESGENDDEEPSAGRRRGRTGISIRFAEDLPVVVEVRGAAARAGVELGWVLERVGDREVGTLLEKVASAADEPAEEAVMKLSALRSLLRGKVGEEKVVVFRDGEDQVREKRIVLEEPEGVAHRFGYLPELHVRFEAQRLEERFGYFRLNAFFDPVRVMPAFAKEIQSFADTKGIVIDLRGNPGGIGGMAPGLAGWLLDQPNLNMGTMKLRDTTLKFTVNPRSFTYRGPVAILIDELSMSTAEIFASGLQDLGRARLFGTRSPGAALPSMVERLPNGDGFQYAFADFTRLNGEPLEGKGVVPEESVPYDRDSLLRGQDPVLAAALSWIDRQESGE